MEGSTGMQERNEVELYERRLLALDYDDQDPNVNNPEASLWPHLRYFQNWIYKLKQELNLRNVFLNRTMLVLLEPHLDPHAENRTDTPAPVGELPISDRLDEDRIIVSRIARLILNGFDEDPHDDIRLAIIHNAVRGRHPVLRLQTLGGLPPTPHLPLSDEYTILIN